MKKILLISVLILMATTSLVAQNDFRKGSWGDSKAEIIAREGEKDASREPNIYAFEGSVAGEECLVGYLFTDDKLFRGVYQFVDSFTDGKECVREYTSWKELLKKKYGGPDADELNWVCETWKNNPNHYADALSHGDVSYVTEWFTDTTKITLMMQAADLEICTYIYYDGIELSKENQAKILEDL